jgi:AraC-like DNA-binding protein
MRWSLSEFLNLVELRSQTWCFVDLAVEAGFSVPHGEEIYFYYSLEGMASIAGTSNGPVDLRAGDVVMVLSGEAHALRTRKKSTVANLPFLVSGEYADAPPTFQLGEGSRATRVLAGRLKVRWPGGQHPRSIAAVLRLQTGDGVVNLERLLREASGGGGTALLTRAATLLFVSAFRENAHCRSAFQEFDLLDPVFRAQQYMETHPFQQWTVEILAHKVGMGRSNFATRFAEHVGRTPMEFLSEERMKHAALFLEKTDMKIAEIGGRVGYRSEAAFIRRFASQFGVTPGESRRLHRQPAPQDRLRAATIGQYTMEASHARG